MGCCSSASKATRSTSPIKKTIEDTKPPVAIQEIQQTGQLMQRLQQVSSFKCEMTGMIQLHNYLAYVRETKSAQKILILDISKTSSLTVADEQVITVEMLSENDSPTPKLPADALSNKSDSRIIVNASELGLFKCQLLDLY